MSVNHEAKLVENISNLLKKDTFKDTGIRLNNGVMVEANKVILASMSTFFCKQLEEMLVCTSDGKFLEIDVNTSSTKKILDLVIRYFYTGKMYFEALSLKDLLDLLNLLAFLDMNELYTLVEDFTRKKIDEGSFSLEKILILLSTAEAYCFAFIQSFLLCILTLTKTSVTSQNSKKLDILVVISLKILSITIQQGKIFF